MSEENKELANMAAKHEINMAYLGLFEQFGNLLGQIAGKNKGLAIAGIVISQAASIGQIIANTAIANAKAVAATPLTFGMPFVAINTVSVNATAGFSVVTYTGTGANATVGHGLGVAPRMIIVKRRNNGTDNWRVYHASIGAGNTLALNSTNASASSSVTWNNTAPTSTVFSVGTESNTNASGSTIVAYCWAEIAGFSKFGSYTGNGSTDGTFVYTGFRPKFIIIKTSSNVDSWYVLDTSRSTYNATNQRLFPNLSNAESSGDAIDILSNGFKNRSTTTINNLNGATYIYMAFAENPFKNALAR